MESLRSRVLLGLAVASAIVIVMMLRQTAAPPPPPRTVETTAARPQRCSAPLPRLDIPADEIIDDEIDPTITDAQSDEERALAISTLTTVQRALQGDDEVTLARIAHSTGMIFFPSTPRHDVASELKTVLASVQLDAIATD